MNLPHLASVCVLWGFGCGFGRADVVTEWNSLLLDAIRNESTSPPLAARNLAILHLAIFDAVNSIDSANEPYFISLPAPSGALVEAAVVGAGYECASYLYPSQLAAFNTAYDQFLARTPESQAREDGLTLGSWAGFAILDLRSGDGSSTTVPYIPSGDPGQWRRTPPFFRPPELPQWPYVTPFAMTNGPQFRPPGPPSLGSTQYVRDFNLTKDVGGLNSTNRTAEQTLIARFWSDFNYSVTPPGHWNQIAQNVCTNRSGTLAQTARLFALLNMGMADAGIVAWDAKYVFNSWRPVTAIREADTDGNPNTLADANWAPLLNTPPFPEYISGHSIFSSTAASILAAFYGSDNIHFTVGSDTVLGAFRSYDSFAAAAEEIGMSRIYGGIHFLSADLDALETGRMLGEYVTGKLLKSKAAVLTMRRTAEIPTLVSVVGLAGERYVVQSSDNLIVWSSVVTNAVPFSMEIPTGAGKRFFRAILPE